MLLEQSEIKKLILILDGDTFKLNTKIDTVVKEYTWMLKDLTLGSPLYNQKERQLKRRAQDDPRIKEFQTKLSQIQREKIKYQSWITDEK